MTPVDINHPHEPRRMLPNRIPTAEVRALSVIQPTRALAAIAEEWVAIIAACALCERFFNPALYVLAVMVIGARQHALAVLGHDASHFRLLPGRRWNDFIGNFFVMWPVFAFVEGFRHYHGPHHQDTGGVDDGNRVLWRTHNAKGELVREWIYPKTAGGLLLVLVRRVVILTGIRWIIRALVGPIATKQPPMIIAGQLAFYAAAASLITVLHAWRGVLLYWIVPFCTWHVVIQYVRLICEHSAVRSEAPPFRVTRTTIPRLLERWLILPRNIGYHIDHHDYPSVPWYRLPELHARLLQDTDFAKHADIQSSVLASLRECISPIAPVSSSASANVLSA